MDERTSPAGPADGQGPAARPVIVKLYLPFSPERRGRPWREQVVGWDRGRTGAYLEALRREIEANAGEFDDCVVTAVRLGGGVVSGAPAQLLSDCVRSLRRCIPFADGRVGTQAGPSRRTPVPDKPCAVPGAGVPVSARVALHDISGASAPWFRRIGVGRFDVDIQALDDVDFLRLNHSDAKSDLTVVTDNFLHANNVVGTLGYILAYGFDAPDTRSLRRSVLAVVRSNACHLVLERWLGGPQAEGPTHPSGAAAHAASRSRAQLAPGPASVELEAAQLAEARDVLGSAGWVEYLPLHFALPGYEDAFWLARTRGVDEIGFGLGARTRLGGALSTNTDDWGTYLRFSDDYTRITAQAGRAQA